MANPTAAVPARTKPFGADDKFYLPYPTGQSDLFQNMEMIGLDPSSGYGAHFDDTKPLVFWGLFGEPQRQISSDLPSPILLMCRRPQFVALPLVSGNIGRGYQVGAPVYAANSGAVTLSPTGLSFANLVGEFVDIATGTPETVTGATWIWIAPLYQARGSGFYGVLVGPDAAHTWGVEVLNRTVEAPISAARTYTLPTVADTVAGDSVTFITTAGASVLTLAAASGEHINGAASYALAAAEYSVAELLSDGTQWLLARKI